MNRFRLLVLAAVFAGLICVSAASAQTISVVSGNGQVLGLSNLASAPTLVVKVTDASGNPLPGATINWSASGLGQFATGGSTATTITDQNGQSTVVYFLNLGNFPSSNFLTAISQTTITASLVNSNVVSFTLTQILSSGSQTGVIPQVQASLVDQNNIATTFAGDVFTGAVGTTGSRTITIKVAATNGQATNAIPGASVQLINYQDPSTGPALACAQTDPNAGFGSVLTDANGFATCQVVYGGQPGQGLFVVAVGGVPSAVVTPAGFWQLGPFDINNPATSQLQTSWFGPLLRETVTPGAAQSIKISSGNNQNALPGTILPNPLVVEVDDANTGKPLSGSAVTWFVSPANAANLSNTSVTTDFNGRASTGLTLSGNASGIVSIRVSLGSNSTKSVTFSINVSPPVTVTGFTIVSGNNQTASVNTAFAQPLVVQLTTSAGSPAGVIVTFSSSSSVVFLSSTTATTDANGRAQINASSGSVTGSATVTASVAGAGSQTFSLAVVPPAPTITAGNFVNGADLQANSLSPCSLGAIVTAQGALGVTGSATTFPGLPVPNTNVRLTINNVGAPILSIGSTPSGQQEVTFQVPCEVSPGTAVPATLGVGNGSSNISLAVGAASPGIFQTQMSDGQYRAVIVRPDGSYVSLNNPARRGETVQAMVTGLGPTTPGVGTQGVPQPGTAANVQGTIVVGMAGQAVPFTYARLSEDLPGVYVVGFQIPADMSAGNDVTFSISEQVAGTTFTSGLSHIPVQ